MPTPFASHCTRVEQHLQTRYGIAVVTRDIPDPLTGDLDGLEIHVDFAVTPEQRLFLLAHLFGHTVQWNVNPRSLEIGREVQPPVDESLLPEILDYERGAAAYGLSLLHEAGISDLDLWFSAYSACDQQYLLHFYRTNRKSDFRSFWPVEVPLLQPKPIPPFHPVRHRFRMDGVVI